MGRDPALKCRAVGHEFPAIRALKHDGGIGNQKTVSVNLQVTMRPIVGIKLSRSTWWRRKYIRMFKSEIVANFVSDDLEGRIKNNVPLPASVIYCVAAILEGIVYLNGSPQNTFHPAIVELA